MILTIGGKTVTELVGSEEITYDRQSPSVRRRLLCDWADAPTVCETLLGYVARVGITSLVRTPPTRHPDPKYNFLIAQRARVSGLGVPSQDGLGIIAYTKAIIEVEYLPPPGTDGGDSNNDAITFLTERRDPSAEFVTLPKLNLYWATGDSSSATASTSRVGESSRMMLIVPTTHITIDVHWWFTGDKRITEGVFDRYQGFTNKNKIRFFQTFYEAETLLYNGASFVRQWTTKGFQAWQVTLNFTFKRSRWNRAFRDTSYSDSDTGDPGYFTFCGAGGTRLYPRLDYRLLLP